MEVAPGVVVERLPGCVRRGAQVRVEAVRAAKGGERTI